MSKHIDISGMGYRDAFHAFFHQNFGDDPALGASYLFECAKNGEPDNIVWPLLERTGDVGYTAETFLKASKLVLSEAIREKS